MNVILHNNEQEMVQAHKQGGRGGCMETPPPPPPPRKAVEFFGQGRQGVSHCTEALPRFTLIHVQLLQYTTSARAIKIAIVSLIIHIHMCTYCRSGNVRVTRKMYKNILPAPYVVLVLKWQQSTSLACAYAATMRVYNYARL